MNSWKEFIDEEKKLPYYRKLKKRSIKNIKRIAVFRITEESIMLFPKPKWIKLKSLF